MSIIQTLRDKAAWIISGAIAVALIVFVVEEGIRNSAMGGSDSVLGKVNGTTIDRQEFEEKFKRVEDRYTQMGYPMDDATRNQQKNNLWNEYVEDAVMNEVYDDLGLDVTDKELGDYLYGANPPQDLQQRFTDPKTGQYDANAAYQTIQKIRSQKSSADYKSFFGEYIPALIKFRKREKYEAMVTNSAYAPKWLIEKMSAENSQAASISYVNVPYTTIVDSSVKVTDAEINDYVSKHKAAFKQEKAAAIDYVLFSGAPSAADTAAVLNALMNVKDSFATTADVSTFLLTENSQTPYYNSFISKKEIKIAAIDSIITKPVGTIYGPYLDGGSYVMARVLGSRSLPDTVKVRHILVATQQQDQQGNMMMVRSDDDAKKLADSLAGAIRNGAIFDTLCARFSDDGNKNTGGIYEGVVTGRMVSEFNDFIFTNGVGAKGVVKTDFGYHYIEILSQKGSSAAYKIAYLSRPVLTSDETVNNAMGQATQFAGQSRTKKEFDENARKKNLNVFNAVDIKPLDASVVGINGNARELVRWIFNDAEKEKVAERPFPIGTSYVVPVLTLSFEEGTMNAERARPTSEFRIRQQKKAAMIAEKAGKATTLDELAKNVGGQVFRADSLSFGNPQIPNLGFEAKVVGAAFNKANQQKISGAITGESGVFFIKTEGVVALPNPNLDVKGQQGVQQQQLRMFSQRSLFENKRKAAKVTDNRYIYF